jgi:hypothetical protein
MYADRQNQSKRIIYCWSLNPAIAMLFRAKAGAWLLIYLYVKWRLGFPHYMTKQKRTWIRLDKYRDGKIRVRYGSKNQEQSFKKIRKRKLIQLHLLENLARLHK